MNNEQQKIAWVVGVNQGIGLDIMQRLDAENIRVIGFDQAKDKIPEYFIEMVHLCDVRNQQQISKLCKILMKDSPPDYFIHVAGILHLGEHNEISFEKCKEIFEINFFSFFHFCKQLTPYFKNKKMGNMVVVSSNASKVPRMKMSAYGASKSALTYFTKTVALELAEYGIRVNIVSPGSTATAMQYQLWKDEQGEQNTISGNLAQFKVGIPLKKIAKTRDITNAVMFLISEQSSHITMHDLIIDGGATLGT